MGSGRPAVAGSSESAAVAAGPLVAGARERTSWPAAVAVGASQWSAGVWAGRRCPPPSAGRRTA
eukprot:2453562-Lingulodinium_polyedra.AAC.1